MTIGGEDHEEPRVKALRQEVTILISGSEQAVRGCSFPNLRESGSEIKPPRSRSIFPFRPKALAVTLTVALAWSGMSALYPGRAQAYDGGGMGLVSTDDTRSRGTWVALLGGYLALGALAAGGAYLWRDNLVGRTIAVTSAGWGGLGLGAGAAYGLVRLHGCGSADCAGEEEVATAIGGGLGSIAGTLAGYLMTRDGGMSRPYTAGAGLTPAFFYLSIGAVTDW